MYNRCYSKAYQESRSWYKGCTVCEEWLDPEHGLDNFGQWCNEHYYIVEGEGTIELDKDIRIKGNRIYGPETCLFVPKAINCMFAGSSRKNERGLPTGVCYDSRRQLYYPMLIGLDGKPITDKEWYSTPEEAWDKYASFKKDYTDAVAQAYRSVIPNEVYEAIVRYQFSIDD